MNIFKNEEKPEVKETVAEPAPVTEPVAETPVQAPVEGPQPEPTKVEDLESAENEETLISTLEKLREQINALKLEKQHVIESEEKLRVKIESEIETKKHNIEGLKAEIPVLKQRCERLANILQIPICK